MKLVKTLAVATTLVCVLAAVTSAGTLEKRHGVGIRAGMWNMSTDAQVDIPIGSISTSFETSGFLGGVAYNYWLTESVALDIEVSVMQVKAETSVGILSVATETSSVTSVLLGLKYYPTYESSVRPFVKAAVGMYSGSQTGVRVGTTVAVDSRSERALGGQLGGGADFVLSRKLLLGVNLGYNLVSDFGLPIGGSDNYSGPEFSVGLSFMFGGGGS